AKRPSLDDIKLTAAAGFFRVVISCRSDNTSFMKQALPKLCRYLIPRIAVSQMLSDLCAPALRIPGLYHKPLNDPMEQYTVIKNAFYEFQKIIPMQRSGI